MSEEPKNLAFYCMNEACALRSAVDGVRDVKLAPYPCMLCGGQLVSARFGPLALDELHARVEYLEGEREAVVTFLRQKATDTSNRTAHRVLAKAARQIDRGAHRKQVT